jgi:hypothetical protein
VIGFNVYTGISAESLQRAALVGAGEASYTVNHLPAGTIYFAVTAISSNGMESLYSNISSKTFN